MRPRHILDRLTTTTAREIATSRSPLAMLLAVLLLSIGCQKSNQSANETTAPNPDLSAVDILTEVRDRYQEAESYADRGEFVLRYQLEGQQRQEKHPFELSFRQPNEFHLRTFNASLMGNGSQIAFAVSDPATNHMDQQVVMRKSPRELELLPIDDDPIVAFFTAGGSEIPLANEVTEAHLELSHPAMVLLAGSRKTAWFGGAKTAARLPDKSIDGNTCYRVRIKSPYGIYVIWISAADWTIRRLEFPTDLLDPELSQAPQVANLEMYAELQGATFEPELTNDAFAFRLPQNVNKVRSFVSLPEPFPSQLIGKKPGAFKMPVLGQSLLENKDLNGSLTAMLWFSSDPICQPIMNQFGDVRDQLKDSTGVKLLAVSTDPISKTNDVQLLKQVRDWGCDELVARADQSIGLGVFDVRALPTVIVTDKQGEVQFFRTIENGQLLDELVAVLRRLQRGEDVAAEMRAEYQRYLDQYADQLKAADPTRRSTSESTPATSFASVAAATLPADLQLKPLWSNSDFQAAGNIAWLPNANSPTWAVLDGFRTVVTLDSKGLQQERHSLELPTGTAATLIEPLQGAGKEAFLSGSVLAQRWICFDKQWKILGSFPKQSTSQHSGIRDMLVLDRGNQSQILVGYWQDKGLELYDLNGQLLASNRDVQQINSIVETKVRESDQPTYWTTGNDGVFRQFDQQLNHIEDKPTEGTISITHLFDCDSLVQSQEPMAISRKQDQATLLGLAASSSNATQIIGLNEQLEPVWEQTVSGETFAHEIRFVSFGLIDLGKGNRSESIPCWLVARPDGSLHVLSTDGSWKTQFAVGFAPTGISISQVDGRSVLLVAGQGGVAAWEINRVVEVSQRSEETSDQK